MNFFGSLFTLYDEFLDFRRRFCEFLSSFRNSEIFCKYGFVFVYAFHKFLEYILYFSIKFYYFSYFQSNLFFGFFAYHLTKTAEEIAKFAFNLRSCVKKN